MDRSNGLPLLSAGTSSVRWHLVVTAVALVVAWVTSLWAYRANENEVLLESELASLHELVRQKEVALAEAARYASAMERRVQLLVQNKPFLPIRMTMANHILGQSKAIILKNMQIVPLSVAARFVDSVARRETTMLLEFGPGESLEIGPDQGWAFSPGQEITLVNESYSIKRLRVP